MSFGLALLLGLLSVTILQKKSAVFVNPLPLKSITQEEPTTKLKNSSGGVAHAPCYTNKGLRCFPEKSQEVMSSNATGLKIISKPRAFYPDKLIFNESRLKQYQGKKVVLRVTFLANGQIGAISIITDLPEGLTEQAIAAARNIKFEPATRDGKTISVTKPVEYSFTIY